MGFPFQTKIEASFYEASEKIMSISGIVFLKMNFTIQSTSYCRNFSTLTSLTTVTNTSAALVSSSNEG